MSTVRIKQTMGDSTSKQNVEESVRETITNRRFQEWYREREFERNILNGNHHYNGPRTAVEPTLHSPSQLLRCHRRRFYALRNAPKEGTEQSGYFWQGRAFETDHVLPFLRDAATTADTYVTESIAFKESIEYQDTQLEIAGRTDPVVVDAEGRPVLVTEIKLRPKVSDISEASVHHRAQLHAYLYALSERFDRPTPEGLILYGDRETLEIRTFPVSFDAGLWERCLEWMAQQTALDRESTLPPGTPELDWECRYCEYSHRCGQESTPYSDEGAVGLLPVFDRYSADRLREYFKAYQGEGARLTPTLASQYPGLAEEFGAYDWRCVTCDTHYGWSDIDANETDESPFCPNCLDSGRLTQLSGPSPDQQLDRRPPETEAN